jgi:cellulose synthase/poly-beta-1,6-N-acetylglucosamine synthase-like glycosyltransferase
VRIVNGCRVADGRVLRVALPRSPLANFQTVEYLHGFLQGRLGWSWINALLIISGAFGVFRTDVLRAIGGYSTETVAEDMEIVVRLHRHFRSRREPYRVVFVPDPVCWTEVPEQLGTLRRQRRRWQRGLAQVMSMHRGLFFRPGSGLVGWLAMPVFALELMTPVVEMAGYLVLPLAFATGAITWNTLLFYFLVAFLLATFYACFAVLLEEFTYRRYASPRDLLRLFFYAVCKQAGYHQVVTWWRLEGTWEFLRGRKQWGEQQRAGFGRAAARRPA